MAELTRRDFMKLSALVPALAAGAGTARAQNLQRPETMWGGERVRSIPSVCEMCFWKCGIRGKVSGGRLVRIEGNPEHPLTKGRLCARGNAGMGLLYDPDRLKYPLKRVGARGEGKFKRISWDEAMEMLTSRFMEIKEQHGPHAIALFPHGSSSTYFKSAMLHLGSSSYSMGSFFQCRGPMTVAWNLTFGKKMGSPEPLDLPNARAILLIGSHLGENVHTSQTADFAEAISRGARLVVVDPRYSVAASKAEYWLPVRPGTDTLLLLGIVRELLETGNYDKEYIKTYATGLEELKEAVKDATPEKVEAETDIPAASIREVAALLGESGPAVVIHPGRHTTWYGNDTQRERAMAILTALLGAWGREGGIFMPTSFKVNKCPCTSLAEETPCPDNKYPLREEGMPPVCIIDHSIGEDKKIRAWMLYGQNLLHSAPNPYRTMQAMKELDFIAAVDIMPSDTVMWADLVLPEATYLERYDKPFVVRTAKTPYVALRQPVVPPMYECRDGFTIAKDFLRRAEMGECFPCETVEETFQAIFKDTPVKLETLLAEGVQVFGGRPFPEKLKFKTESGKIELYSKTLKQHGYDPVPRYEPVEQPPAGRLRLLYGRSPLHSFSRSTNNRLLTELMPENPIWINDKLAESMRLQDGDRIKLENREGYRSNEGTLRVTAGLRPDVIYTVHGFGSRSRQLKRAFGRGISDNFLITETLIDPIIGSPGLRANFVRVVKAGIALDAPQMSFGAAARKRKKSDMLPMPAATPKSSPNKAAPPPAPAGEGGDDEGGC